MSSSCSEEKSSRLRSPSSTRTAAPAGRFADYVLDALEAGYLVVGELLDDPVGVAEEQVPGAEAEAGRRELLGLEVVEDPAPHRLQLHLLEGGGGAAPISIGRFRPMARLRQRAPSLQDVVVVATHLAGGDHPPHHLVVGDPGESGAGARSGSAGRPPSPEEEGLYLLGHLHLGEKRLPGRGELLGLVALGGWRLAEEPRAATPVRVPETARIAARAPPPRRPSNDRGGSALAPGRWPRPAPGTPATRRPRRRGGTPGPRGVDGTRARSRSAAATAGGGRQRGERRGVALPGGRCPGSAGPCEERRPRPRGPGRGPGSAARPCPCHRGTPFPCPDHRRRRGAPTGRPGLSRWPPPGPRAPPRRACAGGCPGHTGVRHQGLDCQPPGLPNEPLAHVCNGGISFRVAGH